MDVTARPNYLLFIQSTMSRIGRLLVAVYVYSAARPMPERRYITEPSACHPAVETALRECLRDGEEFILGLKTTDRFIRRDTRLVVTDQRVVIVYSGFLDVWTQDVPLTEIESVGVDGSGAGLPELELRSARSVDRFDVTTPPTEFIDAVRTARRDT